MNLLDKRIVITGAAAGIGAETLTQLAALRCQILAVDLNLAALQATIQSVATPRATILTLEADLALAASTDLIFATAEAAIGGVDCFIANAGFAYYEQLNHADWAHIQHIYAVNVAAPIYAAVQMKERYGNGTNKAAYKTVILASAMGLLGIPGYALYGSTKAAIDRFAEAYRFELADPRQLMLVYPIGTRTQFFQSAGAPVTFPTQSAAYVAARLIDGIKHDRRTVSPSMIFNIMWVLTHLVPALRQVMRAPEVVRFNRWRGRSSS